ncbi:MAG: chromosome segregation protein SMC, partial [Acidimicrobiia bacterium]|nr:chromosome segregation protein SMC [Acidimicrobiia bacterium]
AELEDRQLRARTDHDAARAELVGAGAGLVQAEAELTAGLEELRRADAEHNSWSARATALAAAIDEARARAGVERLTGVADVAGTLLELVDVDTGWEAAFEAAAGAALAAVVVGGGSDGARNCLERLRDDGAGTVLALSTGTPPAPTTAPPAGVAVRDHVRPRHPEIGPLLDRLVGPAVCVGGDDIEAWRSALDAATAAPGAVIVTLAGDRFAPDGWRVGATTTGASRRALDEAQERAEAAAGEAREAEDRRDVTRVALDQARKAEARATCRLQELDGELRTVAEARARVQRQEASTSAEATEVRLQLDSLTATLEHEQARMADLVAALPALEDEEAAAAEHGRVVEARRRHVAEEVSTAASRRSEAEARAKAVDERCSWLQRRLAEVEARLAGNVAQRARAETRRVELDRRLGDIDRLAACVATHLAWLGDASAELREHRRLRAEATRAEAGHLDGLRGRRRAREQRLEQLREHGVRAGMEAQELVLRAEAAVEALRRDLDAEPEAARAAACPRLMEGTTAIARSRELERELRLMGPVNPLALEEAAALRERQEFLDGQLDDVKSSRRELAKVIRSVDEEIVEQFVAAFADVSANFSHLFSLLFPGGEGSLELTDPSHPLETGIRVRARPSGKNVRSISLLSGGERSLTALAYLFAVFRSRPSPFYILDEVEAALDDVNLHRFLELVGEFRREAQLVIVSHQQRTMETADVLYGVTMAPGGASGVVSERMAPALG